MTLFDAQGKAEEKPDVLRLHTNNRKTHRTE